MKKITIELTRKSADGSSATQATESTSSLNIMAEQVSSPTDIERLKEIITNAGLLFKKELDGSDS